MELAKQPEDISKKPPVRRTIGSPGAITRAPSGRGSEVISRWGKKREQVVAIFEKLVAVRKFLVTRGQTADTFR